LALVENKHRTRQALRSIKSFMDNAETIIEKAQKRRAESK